MPRARKYLWAQLLAVAAVLIVVAILMVANCNRGPHAPALGDDPLYQNSSEGFRFLAPEGWSQHARGEAPPGKAEKERLLVEYQRLAGGKLAMLEVSLIDLPQSQDLAAYLAEPSYGVDNWRLKGTPATLQINGVEATRYSFTGRPGKDEVTREVVAFHRGERTYFFAGLYISSDAKAREQLRGAVESTIWSR